jgi:hypothetical protein
MTKPRGLSVISDAAEDTPEDSKDTFTFEELYLRNAATVRKAIDAEELDHQAAVMLFVSTVQMHMQAVREAQMQGES